MSKRIIGVYDTEQEAIRAVDDLKQQGFSADDISVVAKNRDNVSSIEDETGSKVEEGLATGAAAGGAVGGITGLLAGLGALALPGIGPLVAAGPIAAALTGAAAGAGVGGISGALIGMGIPEDEANRYDADVNAGKILVMVDDDVDRRNYDDTYTGTYLGTDAGSATYGTMDGRPGVTEDGYRDGYATDNVRAYDDSNKHTVRNSFHDAKETIKDKYHELKHDVNNRAYTNRTGGAYSDDTRNNYVDGNVPDPQVAGANITGPAERGTEYTDEEQRRLRAGLRDKTGYGDYDPTR